MSKFDQMAASFDTEKRIERSEIFANEIRLHINDSKTALEFGCGTGLLGINLIDEFDTVLFMDSSPKMIEQVKNKLNDLGKQSSAAICCDIMAETPPDIHVDFIFTSLVLHHIKDTQAILLKLYNMLNDGGKLIIIDLDADDGGFHAKHPHDEVHNGFDQASLCQLAKNAGFKNAESKSFYYGSKVVDDKQHPYSLFILECTSALTTLKLV